MRRTRPLVVCAALILALLPATPGWARHHGGVPHLARVHPGVRGPLTGAAARATRGELLPIDGAALAAARRRAESHTAPMSGTAPTGPLAPVVANGAEGLNDSNFSPSDSTGAVGPNSYIENVNSEVAIYNKTFGLIDSDTLEAWWGETGASVFDPQVIWDATTHRFFYAGDAVFSNTDNRIAFGFSTDSTPTTLTTTDWCQYEVGYGSEFPDFPKLGDSRDFAIVGVNVFHGNNFARSDVFAVGKLGAGPITTCPAPNALAFGIGTGLKVNGVKYFTPVPANEIDSRPKGYVLTRAPGLPASKLGLFTVTKDRATGDPVIQQSGTTIRVGSYDVPLLAPQLNGNYELDTSDARLTQAVAAVDPKHGGRFAIWTQHAVFGGAGSMERWYEIDPARQTVIQKGTVSDPDLDVFNGAISPDRVVLGSVKDYGGSMVMGFTTSSSATYPAIQMVSKRGNQATSSFVLVQQSPGYDEDFGCPQVVTNCRWGDYSAATPDPGAPVGGSVGSVFLTNMWTADATTTGGTSGVSWRTWNWQATP